MKTINVSAGPKRIGLGRCMLQGFAGGVLASVALMMLYLSRGLRPERFIVLFWAAVPMIASGVLGMIKALVFWALSRITGSRLRVIPRIILGGIVTPSLLAFSLIGEDKASVKTIVLASGFMFLLTLPTSLLIGSRVRVGKLFTSDIGGLPLRLMSTVGLLFCLLACASWQLLGEDIQQDMMFRYFPLAYFSMSLYLTLKPRGKTVLLISAAGLNVPLVLALGLSNQFQSAFGWQSGEATDLRLLCIALLAAWTIFVATRLRASATKAFHPGPAIVSDHQCLGSRFAEWQQRVA